MSSSSNYNYFRSWMDQPHIDPHSNLLTDEFAAGLQEFMTFACHQPLTQETNKMYCPCSRCENRWFVPVTKVWKHLYARSFTPGYKVWFMHGENESMIHFGNTATVENEPIGHEDAIPVEPVDSMIQMVNDRFQDNINDAAEENATETQQFFQTMAGANQPIYEGCKEGVSALSVATKLMSIKTDFNLSEDCVDRIADFGQYLCPQVNSCPETYYDVQKLVHGLGLPYETIDVCIHNCMLFWNRDKDRVKCRFCGEARYDITSGKNRIGRKKMWYLPLTHRLKRLYQSTKTASSMRWHAEHTTNDEIKHPSDAKAWKHFQDVYPDFASEPRNVYLGLSTDGFNPFGRHGRQYSLWPVILTPYNLPPLLCMNKEFLFLTILVTGPNHPKRSLDVFLQPLIHELQVLWGNGVNVQDASCGQQFCMRAVLMWTISDFPAYGMLSGWTTHGRLSCPYCQDESNAFQLKHGRKSCWFDCHRRFLPNDHPYRYSQSMFTKNRQDFDPPPRRLTGHQQLSQLSEFGAEETVSCGGNGDTAADGYGSNHHWHKKSIFWKLPYWKDQLLRHNLDVMHIEKNFFDNIMNTVLNVVGKTKDNVNSRKDLPDICSRRNLHLLPNGRGPIPSFRLSQEGKQALFLWITQHVKFPDGYASNLRNCVDYEAEKFVGMKSHDCHVFMQRLLPFVFNHLLPSDVHRAIAAVGAFFRDLCSRTVTVDGMKALENKIPVILCNLEKIFPPSFFDVMEHLPIHLPSEAELGGPVQYRWMYPFERFMFDLKKKVKNMNRVEGSIVHQSLNEETSYLADYYFPPEVKTKKRRPSRHDDGGEKPVYHVQVADIFTEVGRLTGKAKPRVLSDEEYNHLHTYILNNCDEIEAYQSIYKDQVMEKYPDMTEDRFEALKEKQFSKWLQFYVNSCIAYGTHVPEWLKDIVFGPFKIVNLYPRYCTRGYAFRIAKRDVNRTTVDSGVSSSSGDMTYYGVLKEIMEVMYPGGIGLKCIVFNCDWYDSVNGVKVDEFGVTSVHSGKHLTKFDPFILASQADQVCYLRYPMKGDRATPWLVVTNINPRGTVIGNPEGNPLQQIREGDFSVHNEPHVNLTTEGEDFVLQVTDDEGEEFEDDEDSIPSSSEEDSG